MTRGSSGPSRKTEWWPGHGGTLTRIRLGYESAIKQADTSYQLKIAKVVGFFSFPDSKGKSNLHNCLYYSKGKSNLHNCLY